MHARWAQAPNKKRIRQIFLTDMNSVIESTFNIPGLKFSTAYSDAEQLECKQKISRIVVRVLDWN